MSCVPRATQFISVEFCQGNRERGPSLFNNLHITNELPAHQKCVLGGSLLRERAARESELPVSCCSKRGEMLHQLKQSPVLGRWCPARECFTLASNNPKPHCLDGRIHHQRPRKGLIQWMWYKRSEVVPLEQFYIPSFLWRTKAGLKNINANGHQSCHQIYIF